MKTVFQNNEICHIYANQQQYEGRANSIFFYGPVIYSYGYHFPMGKIIAPDTILISSDSYSRSTSKHLRLLRVAVSHMRRVFVHKPADNPQKNEQHYISVLNANFSKLATNCTKGRLENITNAINEANTYFEAVKYKPSKEYKKLAARISEIATPEKIKELKNKARENAKKAKEKKAKEVAKFVKYWRTGVIPNNIKSVSFDYDAPVFLRLVNSDVESSKGVKIPIDQARHICSSFFAGKLTSGMHIGSYSIKEVNQSQIIAGCHIIPSSEIQYIFNLIK